MAGRAQPVTSRWPGAIAAALVAALILGTLGAVAFRAEAGRGLGASDWAVVRFTITQAILSALFSVALAIPVARALARRRFAGRSILIALLGAPFILPVIVAILGLAFLALPIIEAVRMASSLLPVSLVDIETRWLQLLLAPINSVAAGIALGALGIRKFFRWIFG